MQITLIDECLNYIHIDDFGLLLKNCSEYKSRESWRIQCPNTIEPVSKDQEHIQILYSCNDIKSNINGHWVCSYYNTKTIYIYDSLNLKWLHVHHKVFLEKLYPFYSFENKPIHFPKVQEQPNNNDSGVFAIAFAVSLLFGLRPDTIMYDYSLMRQHLTQIFQSNKVEHFPRIIRPGDPKQLFSLDEIKKRKILAKKKQDIRQKKSKNDKNINVVHSRQILTNSSCLPMHTNKLKINKSTNFDYNITEKNTIKINNPFEQSFKEMSNTNIVSNNILPLNIHNMQTILKDEWLEDIHIDHFGLLLKKFSEYEPQESYKIQCPDRIKPVPKDKKHIQILHSCSDIATNLDGHWVCSYYDTKLIYIYDSLNLKHLHVHHKIYLEKLYPFYTFNEQSIKFPKVQNQSNGYDCGVFAIAFAVSLFHDIQPDTITYDQNLMRQHLVQMFELNRIEHFPIISKHHFKQVTYENALNQSDIKCINNATVEDLNTIKRGVKRKINFPNITNNEKKNNTIKRGVKRKINFLNITNNEKKNKKCIYSKNVLLHRNYLLQKTNKNYKNNLYRNNTLVNPKFHKTHKKRTTHKLFKSNVNNILKDNIKLKYTKEIYIRNISKFLKISSLPKKRFEAERIVKWCFHTRKHYITQMKKAFVKCKQKAEVCLTCATEEGITEDSTDYINAFCGKSKHTSSTELYFGETTYRVFNSSESIIINSEGKAINILPLIKSKNKITKAWYCSSLCKIEANVINDLKCCFQELTNCTLKNIHKFLYRIYSCFNRVHKDKLGHSHSCYINYKSCRSWFLAIEIISPHYPLIRYIKRLIYVLIKIRKQLNKLNKALNDFNVNILKDISIKAQQETKNFICKSTEINLNEDEIQSEYYTAFKLFTERSIDIPRHICISCTKYCFERDIMRIKISKENCTTVWSNFINNMELNNKEIYIICKFCNRYFKNNKMPPTCRCNKLEVLPVPKEIEILNDYERILIQRVKAFQIVQKKDTVMNKNLPHKYMISKVKGRTFHLPLPLTETLKKICPSTDPINLNHELYILVRGIPTKANIIWEKLVDVKKIWDVLIWLKENNPIYSDIILPTFPENLLHSELQNVEFEEENNSKIDDKILKKENKIKNKQKHESILTQMSQSDHYYEQFTIYPMYEKKVNESATTLYQMVKVQDNPLDNRHKDLDVKCFPDVYPYGINGQHENRNVPITNFEYIKLRLMSQHSQFRLNIQYLFYLLHDNNMRQLNSGIFHKMNVTNPLERYTAGTYLEQLSKQQLESNLNTIFSKLRNTQQYWRIPRSNLHCMISNYGPATWFLTLSPCEWLWTDLTEYLREVNPQFAKKSENELIALDPVSTARFIDNKFKAMLDFICSSSNPIGEVIHYFWRREYQSRGMQHFHLLIWIKDAPIIDESSNEDIASFILKYVTCRLPNKNISPELYRRVDSHQRHKHNNYCLRIKKTKIKTSKVCRFGFSRPITNTLIMRDVAVSVANRRRLKMKSRLYDLPRSSEEININDYNPTILIAWEGNMDIQFVGEKSTLLTWYTTKYVSKAEKSNIDTFEKINSTKSLRSCLWNLGMRMLNHRECGALEAADTLLGISLYGTDKDTTVRWLDVNMIRNRKLKSFKEIKVLDAESTDIFCPSLIDTYYPNRPVELESTNLYDYAKWYDITKFKPCSKKVKYYVLNQFLYLKKRKRQYLINHYRYNVHIQPERYYFALLLLFKPWRNIDELKNGCNSYAEAFSLIQFELQDALRYHEKMIDIQQGIDNMKELIEEKILEDTKNDNDNSNNCILECVPIELEGAMKDFKDVGGKFEVNNVDEMIAQLNSDQKRIFDKVTAGIVSNSEILRFYVSGAGGTGKSFLIKTIRSWIKKYVGKDTAITAPTGIAAYNIDGLTIHRLFQLPVEHGRTAKYKQLSDVILKFIREELKNVALIIIDEVSMISNITLMYIHLRLTEIFNTDESDNGWFGGKHILFFGDLLQLPPVHEEPPFIELSTTKIEKYVGGMGSINLWSLFKYDELQINVRQQSDNSYRDILSRIRIGIVTDSRIQLF